MTTFFILLFLILTVNAVMMLFSLSTNQKAKKSNEVSKTSISEIHPFYTFRV